MERCDVTQVYKFSKFQHAMAFLHPQKVDARPHWFNTFAAGGGALAKPGVTTGPAGVPIGAG